VVLVVVVVLMPLDQMVLAQMVVLVVMDLLVA
jgi:hypothetical protein